MGIHFFGGVMKIIVVGDGKSWVCDRKTIEPGRS